MKIGLKNRSVNMYGEGFEARKFQIYEIIKIRDMIKISSKWSNSPKLIIKKFFY